MRLQAEARAASPAAPRRRPGPPCAPRWTIRPLSITSTVSPSAWAAWKFCSTSRMVAPRCFTSAKALDQRCRRSPARGPWSARRSAAACAARRWRARSPASASVRPTASPRATARTASAPGRSRRSIEPGVVERSVARGQHQVFLHGQVGKHRHGLRHVADAEPRDVGRGLAVDVARRRTDLRRRRPATGP